MIHHIVANTNITSMNNILTDNLDYNRPIKIAEDVYWVGFNDPERGLHCNPYLILEGQEAILIDGGSRPEFSRVMMKIMQTGVEPSRISTLIYHHYDPDLCGSLPNLEDIIDRRDLRIISQHENNVFIRYYAVRSEMLCIKRMGYAMTFASGRRLRFIPTPYSHAQGAFMTLDEKTGILFSSDIFGSFHVENARWNLFQEFSQSCQHCTQALHHGQHCTTTNIHCELASIIAFHREIMTSNAALRYAIQQIRALKPRMIAPQHGSVFYRAQDINIVIERLLTLDDVGIDGFLQQERRNLESI